MSTAPMPDPSLYVGPCECGKPIYRRTASGVPPKRCIDCRRDTYGGKKPRAAGRAAGPTVRIRRWMRETLTELQTAGAGSPHVIMRQCASVAVAEATGIPDDMAASIIDAIDRLVEDGETGIDIRRRLNPNPFGRRVAGATPNPIAELLDLEDEPKPKRPRLNAPGRAEIQSVMFLAEIAQMCDQATSGQVAYRAVVSLGADRYGEPAPHEDDEIHHARCVTRTKDRIKTWRSTGLAKVWASPRGERISVTDKGRERIELVRAHLAATGKYEEQYRRFDR